MENWEDCIEEAIVAAGRRSDMTRSDFAILEMARNADRARESFIAAASSSVRQLESEIERARSGRILSNPLRCSTFEDMAESAARSHALDEAVFQALHIAFGHEAAMQIRSEHLSVD